MADFINSSVPVANGVTTAYGGLLYPWMSIKAGGGASEFSQVRMRGIIYDKNGVEIVGGGGGGGGGNVPVGNEAWTITYDDTNTPISTPGITNLGGLVGINGLSTEPLQVKGQSSEPLFDIKLNGKLVVRTPNYESLVTGDDDVPNKKYVDDAISGSGAFPVGSVGQTISYNNLNDGFATSTLSNNAGFVGINRESTQPLQVANQGAVPLFDVQTDGRLLTRTANYETLVTTDAMVPNKKYVDDAISLSGLVPPGTSGQTLAFDNLNTLDAVSTLTNNGGLVGINTVSLDPLTIANVATLPLLKVYTSGLVQSQIANYESLLVNDDDLTNKKYVDNAIAISGNVPPGTDGQTLAFNGNVLESVSTLTNNGGNVGINGTATNPLEINSVATTPLLKVYNSGLIRSQITNYETLINNDDDIPNKKYVDGALGGFTCLYGGFGVFQTDPAILIPASTTEFVWPVFDSVRPYPSNAFTVSSGGLITYTRSVPKIFCITITNSFTVKLDTNSSYGPFDQVLQQFIAINGDTESRNLPGNSTITYLHSVVFSHNLAGHMVTHFMLELQPGDNLSLRLRNQSADIISVNPRVMQYRVRDLSIVITSVN